MPVRNRICRWLGLLCLAALGCATARANVSIYLCINGSAASLNATAYATCLANNSKMATKPLSFSYGATAAVVLDDGSAAGATTGALAIPQITLTKTLDDSSFELAGYLKGGTIIPVLEVGLSTLNPNGTTTVVTVKFTNVQVRSVSLSAVADVNTETVVLDYQTVSYTQATSASPATAGEEER
jgi:type VI protein secretion system component Hcp